MRTIVVGDAHGYPQLIRNALDHAGFDPAEDRFVFTGDFLDRGPEPQACLDLIEEYATTVLVGNHELAVLLEDPITPFDASSALFEPYLRGRVLNAPREEAWRCAVAIEGVLITHAGVPARYERALNDECGGDIEAFAEWLNKSFDDSLRASMERWAVDWEGLLGLDGPFWFRPRGLRAHEVLRGVTQIAGHTPVSAEIAEAFAEEGLYLIDPYAYTGPSPDRYRYAVIETVESATRVRIEDSELGSIG
jgi:Calcineurin-like phosphoesterase